MDGRVRVHGTDKDLDLRLDARLFGFIGADNREGADTFTVETHVLGKGLGENNLVAILDKLAQSISVAVAVARGEALVGHVKEHKVIAFLDNLGNFVPLVLCRVDARWVVGASVQKDNRVLGSGLTSSTEKKLLLTIA